MDSDKTEIADVKTVVARLLAKIERLERLVVRMYERQDCECEIQELIKQLYSEQRFYGPASDWIIENMADKVLEADG